MSDACIADVLDRLAEDGCDAISNEDLQTLSTAVRRYSDRAAETRLDAFAPSSNVTATDVMLAATGMLRAVDVQLFEFGIWQTFSDAHSGRNPEAKI